LFIQKWLTTSHCQFHILVYVTNSMFYFLLFYKCCLHIYRTTFLIPTYCSGFSCGPTSSSLLNAGAFWFICIIYVQLLTSTYFTGDQQLMCLIHLCNACWRIFHIAIMMHVNMFIVNNYWIYYIDLYALGGHGRIVSNRLHMWACGTRKTLLDLLSKFEITHRNRRMS
jgi:hypothetical protein